MCICVFDRSIRLYGMYCLGAMSNKLYLRELGGVLCVLFVYVCVCILRSSSTAHSNGVEKHRKVLQLTHKHKHTVRMRSDKGVRMGKKRMAELKCAYACK